MRTSRFIEPIPPKDMSTTQQDLSTVAQGDQITTRPAAARERFGRNAPGAWQHLLSLEDFEEPARRFLPRPIFGYISGGVETNASLRGNRSAFDEYQLPAARAGQHHARRNQKTTIFGRTYDLPFGFPPMGGTSLAAYRGRLRARARPRQQLNTVDDPERRVAHAAGEA